MEWFTVQELVGVGGLPTHPYNVRKRLDSISTEETKRKRQGTKAFEYHISILPLATQAALYKREGKIKVGDDFIDLPKPVEKSYCREALWARWDVAGIRAQEKAKKMVAAVQAVYQMNKTGVGKVAAYEAVAKHNGISLSTIR
ncbi:MAG: DNA-binding protein, partial [Vibrio sp.]|uniref:DNA-binding protein n=1 Tax=Vibrio sp. TaxID=678 RepID=UPI003A8608CE